MSKSYTIIQRALLNSFKTNPLTTITKLKGVKTNTTNLIKTMIKMKDPEFEKLLPKFKQFYEETRTPSDKKSFESRFLKKLTNVDDVNFFESVYNKINIKDDMKSLEDKYTEKKGKIPDGEKYDGKQLFFPKPKLFQPFQPIQQPIQQPSQPIQQPSQPIDLVPESRNRPRPVPQAVDSRSHSDLMDRLNENTPNRSIREIFNTTNKTYKENKQLIDSVISSIDKNDGSWLSTIAALEVPEIAILQKVVNFTPLGFTANDNINLQKIIENPGANISSSDYASVMSKLLVNPDAVGKLVQGRLSGGVSDAKQALSDWGNKIVGNKPSKTTEQQNIEDIVAGRQAKTQTAKSKTDYINNAKGIKKQEQDPDLGLGRNKPKNNSQTAMQYLTPPDIHNYGWKDPTVMEDIGRWFAGAIGLDKGIYTPEQYKKYLQQNNPELYKKYNDELNIYNTRASKVKLNVDSIYDPSVGKNSVESMISLLDKATSESGSLSSLSVDQISDVYDGINMLKDIAAGKRQDVSYSTLNLLSQSLFNELPAELKSKYRPELKAVNDYIEKDLRPSFAGDSDLFNPITDETTEDRTKPGPPDMKTTDDEPTDDTTDDTTETKPDIIKPTDTETKLPETKTPETKTPDDQKEILGGQKINERTMNSDIVGDLRPRLNWGGEAIHQATKEETNFMNAFNEAMSLDEVGWGNGRDNTLFNINNLDTEKRYSNCFAMPKPPPQNPLPPSRNFRESQNIVWNSRDAPLDAYKYMRDSSDFGQYQQLSKRANLSTTKPRQEIFDNPNEFPAQADRMTGGEKIKFNTNFNYVDNQRFTKRR